MTTPDDNRIRFQPGTILATLGAQHVIGENHRLLDELLRRHLAGDWGDVDAADAKANEHAVKHGERILSVYDVSGTKLWVLTEASREATTVLTPGEY